MKIETVKTSLGWFWTLEDPSESAHGAAPGTGFASLDAAIADAADVLASRGNLRLVAVEAKPKVTE